MKYMANIALLILVLTGSTAVYGSQKNQDSTVQKTNVVVNDPIAADAEHWYEHKALPWITSLVIAGVTVVVNLIISFSTRRTSLKVVKQQIESSVNLARIQFQSTLNSKNRQDWINEVRNCMSEFATHVRQLNIHLQGSEENKDKTFLLQEKVYL